MTRRHLLSLDKPHTLEVLMKDISTLEGITKQIRALSVMCNKVMIREISELGSYSLYPVPPHLHIITPCVECHEATNSYQSELSSGGINDKEDFRILGF